MTARKRPSAISDLFAQLGNLALTPVTASKRKVTFSNTPSPSASRPGRNLRLNSSNDQTAGIKKKVMKKATKKAAIGGGKVNKKKKKESGANVENGAGGSGPISDGEKVYSSSIQAIFHQKQAAEKKKLKDTDEKIMLEMRQIASKHEKQMYEKAAIASRRINSTKLAYDKDMERIMNRQKAIEAKIKSMEAKSIKLRFSNRAHLINIMNKSADEDIKKCDENNIKYRHKIEKVSQKLKDEQRMNDHLSRVMPSIINMLKTASN